MRHDVREPWPVADAAVDVVVGNLVLEHVADLAPVYAEAVRVLRPGGQLLLCELHPERQRRGGQAHFTDAATGVTTHVPAFRHTVSEFVGGGLAAGLALRHLGVLKESGLILAERHGQQIVYELNTTVLEDVIQHLMGWIKPGETR